LLEVANSKRIQQMGIERIDITDASEAEVVDRFHRLGINCDETNLSMILSLVDLMGATDDKIEKHVGFPHFPPGVIGFIVPVIHYNINVWRTSLIVAAAIFDALKTNGLISAGLALTGLAKQGIGKLDSTSGEYCCAVHSSKLQKTSKKISAAAVHKMIYGKHCPFAKLHCRLMQEKRCGSKVADIRSLFDSLEDKGALVKKRGEWRVPI
jgi:hypothetical protein